MRLRIDKLIDNPAPGPGEKLVIIRTANGRNEQVIVHETSVSDHTLEIGNPVGREGNKFLVELPREALSGAWRIWVTRRQFA